MKKLTSYQGDLKEVQKLMDIHIWTHGFHVPYKADWREAKIKAMDKIWNVRGKDYGL